MVVLSPNPALERVALEQTIPMLAIYELGTKGRDWLQQRLADHSGPNRDPTMPVTTALHALYGSVPLATGKTVGVLEDSSRGDLHAFEAGRGPDIGQDLPTVARWIHEFLSISPTHLCLVDEQWNSFGDPYWGNDGSVRFADAFLLCENSLLYRLSQANSTEDRVLDLVKHTYSFFFCCALVSCENGLVSRCPPGSQVTSKDVEEAVRDVRGLAVDAYDQDGLVVWTPRQSITSPNNPWA